MRLTSTGDGSAETLRSLPGEYGDELSAALRTAAVRSRDVPPGGPTLACRADRDVPSAVRAVLVEILRERVRDCAALDAVFAEDIAERVAAFTLDGGKMTRAQLLWWGLRACGGGADPAEADRALRLAAGLELIQTCALVHDDVMDGSAVRRGRTALHVALGSRYGVRDAPGPGVSFGRAAAVLAGDLALSWADDVAADAWDTMRPTGDGRGRIRAVWRTMRTEMVAGQYLDLHGQVTGSRAVGSAIRTAMLKSALYSVERPLALGAALAGADDPTTGALCAAGRCAGIAFQLRDDLLGVFGDPRDTGKPSGDDIREGKLTYLTAMATARAAASGNRAVVELLDSAVGNARLGDDGLARVREALVETGARELVEAKIGRLVAASNRHLASVALAPPGGSRLRDLLGSVAGMSPSASAAPARATAAGPASASEPADVPASAADPADVPTSAAHPADVPTSAADPADLPASAAGTDSGPVSTGAPAWRATARPRPAGPGAETTR